MREPTPSSNKDNNSTAVLDTNVSKHERLVQVNLLELDFRKENFTDTELIRKPTSEKNVKISNKMANLR